ncbi:MAG: hypothetical protein AABX04_04330 [Nanoarchaeota archaeon]
MEVNLDSSELVNVIYQKLDQLHEFEPTRVSKTDLPWQQIIYGERKYGNRGMVTVGFKTDYSLYQSSIPSHLDLVFLQQGNFSIYRENVYGRYSFHLSTEIEWDYTSPELWKQYSENQTWKRTEERWGKEISDIFSKYNDFLREWKALPWYRRRRRT